MAEGFQGGLGLVGGELGVIQVNDDEVAALEGVEPGLVAHGGEEGVVADTADGCGVAAAVSAAFPDFQPELSRMVR